MHSMQGYADAWIVCEESCGQCIVCSVVPNPWAVSSTARERYSSPSTGRFGSAIKVAGLSTKAGKTSDPVCQTNPGRRLSPDVNPGVRSRRPAK